MNLRQETPPRMSGTRRHQPLISLPSILSALVIVVVVGVLVVMFPLEWATAPSVTITTDSATFSPNDDGNQEIAVVTYSLSDRSTVTVQVLNAAGHAIRTLTLEETQADGQHSVIWDGRDNYGAPVADGTYRITVEAQGATRATKNNTLITVDTTPPIIRLANSEPEQKVSAPDFVLEGVTDPNATVWLNDEPQPVTLDGSGGFRIQRRLSEGENRFELRAIDRAGNEASVVRKVLLVTKPPDIVIDNPSPGLWINQKLLSTKGRVLPKTTVRVNGKEAKIDDDGSFEVEVLLQEGENKIVFEAIDEVGNVSSDERTVFLKTRPPIISPNTIADGMVIREPSVRVAGQTEPGSSLLINGRPVALDSRGGFQELANLVEGNNLIKLEATDKAGNTSVLERTVVYQTQSDAPIRGLSMLKPDFVTTAAPVLLIGVGLTLAFWLLLGGWLSPISLTFTADRQIIYPNKVGESDVAIFSLNLSRSAKATVEILDDNNWVRVTLLNGKRRDAGQHFLVWDGRDAYGELVPDGAYMVQATASTLTTAVSSAVSVRVDTEPVLLRPFDTVQRRDGRGEIEIAEGQVIDIS